jgi:outer membrane biosynthesis protein TonB
MQAVRDAFSEIGLMRERGWSWAEVAEALAQAGIVSRDLRPFQPPTLRSAFFLVGTEMRQVREEEWTAPAPPAVETPEPEAAAEQAAVMAEPEPVSPPLPPDADPEPMPAPEPESEPEPEPEPAPEPEPESEPEPEPPLPPSTPAPPSTPVLKASAGSLRTGPWQAGLHWSPNAAIRWDWTQRIAVPSDQDQAHSSATEPDQEDKGKA